MNIAEIVKKMSLAQKCAILSGKDVWHTHGFEDVGIPSIALSDGPSGLRKQEGAGDQLGINGSTKATCYPSAATMANSWDLALAEEVGRGLGAEARSQDVQILLGPGLNTKRSPLCGRDFEYFSEDPYLSGKMAAAYVRGIQSQGVSACPKHFAANSQEMHRMCSDSVMDLRTLRELYLTGFEIAVTEGHPMTIMTSYNAVNGEYANESSLLENILRREWGFEGMVVSDWGGDNDFVTGVRNGCNLEMPGTGEDSAVQLYRAVKEGQIDEAIVDERVSQLLTTVFFTKPNGKAPGGEPVDLDAMHELAMRAAGESIVLMKNDGVLPLNGDGKIAVIGDFAREPRFQGAGSSKVNSYKSDVTLDVLDKYFPNHLVFAEGFTREDKPVPGLISEAVEIAKDAEAVLLYIGLTEVFESEGLDRKHMRIPQNQVELLEKIHEVNPNIVVVLTCGSAVEMPWADQCRAIVYACLGGQAVAEAVLRVVRGDINPSGKLAETFPMALSDVPNADIFPEETRYSLYREAIYVGYRYYESAKVPVRFPFGHGLSYTSFRYTNINATESGVSFDLTNVGDRDGAEVAQVYVGMNAPKIFRAARELKGFEKVFLKAGETKTVTIPLDDKAFRYWNTASEGWEIERGVYTIYVGASVEDIRLTAQINVIGSPAPNPYEGRDVSLYERAEVRHVPDAAFETLLGHPIPVEEGMDGKRITFHMNTPLDQLPRCKNGVVRFIGRKLVSMRENSVAKGNPDLNLFFITNMPFRGVAKMMNGMVSLKMAEALMEAANGHWHKGIGKTIHRFFHKPTLAKVVKEYEGKK